MNKNNINGTIVVICLKISIFVVAITTTKIPKYLIISCDLLKNIYLCGSNNNIQPTMLLMYPVVICLKISIFVVAITTKRLLSSQTKPL